MADRGAGTPFPGRFAAAAKSIKDSRVWPLVQAQLADEEEAQMMRLEPWVSEVVLPMASLGF